MLATPWAIYAAPKALIRDSDLFHEMIHIAQWKDLFFIFYPFWYIIEWLLRLIQFRNFNDAYRMISFEREAYANEKNNDYLNQRTRFAHTKYIKLYGKN